MTQHLSLKDEDLVATTIHHTKAKEEQMNRKCDTKKTRQDQSHELMIETTQPILLSGGITPRHRPLLTIIQEIVRNVRKIGWHVVSVLATPFSQPFAYSIGLYKTFGQPEMVVVGLPVQDLGPAIINDIGRLMKKGVTFEDGTENDQIIKHCPCTFREVDMVRYCQYFTLGNTCYQDSEFPMLQCVYPDREGHYPWQPGASLELCARQPLLCSLFAAIPNTELTAMLSAMRVNGTSNEEAR